MLPSHFGDFNNLKHAINRLGFDQNLTNLAKKLNSRERYIMMEAMDQITDASPRTIKQKEVTHLMRKLERISNEKLNIIEKTGNKVNYLSSKVIEKVSPRHEYVKSEILASTIYMHNERVVISEDVPKVEVIHKQEEPSTDEILENINKEIREVRLNIDLDSDESIKNVVGLSKNKLAILEKLRIEDLKKINEANAREQNEKIIEINTEILSLLKFLNKRPSDNKKSELKLDARIQFLEADQTVRKAKMNLDKTKAIDKETIKKLDNKLIRAYNTKITILSNLLGKISEMTESEAERAMMLESLRGELAKTKNELQNFKNTRV